MNDEDDIVDGIGEEVIDLKEEGLQEAIPSDQVDCRRKLEDRLEEIRLRKLTQDYDFD